MLKIIDLTPDDPTGRLFARVVRPGPHLVKEAGARDLHPDIQHFIDGLKSQKGKLYILVNALGAYEFYGANFNSDAFEEDQLRPKDGSTHYGYKTFLDAGVYRNHKNQDKTQSYGKIVCAIYNEQMHRVELIIEIDEELCRKFGHTDLYEKLQRGEKPSVSMGCRVAFDVCSICGHKSRTRADYCECCKKDLGKIRPDGTKVFVYNPEPKFFDLSIVVIGADRTSYVMMKVASLGGMPHMSSAERAEQEGLTEVSQRLRDFVKQATTKRAELTKLVPAMAAKAVKDVESSEPSISTDTLNRLGRHPHLEGALSAAGACGIALKPREFQRVVLVHMGEGGLADQLDAGRSSFCTNCGPATPVDLPDAPQGIGGLLQLLAPLMGARSSFNRPLTLRMTITKEASWRPTPDREGRELRSPLLDKIASAYEGYRQSLDSKIEQLTRNVTERDVGLLTVASGDLLEDALSGYGKAKMASKGAQMALLTPTSLLHLHTAHRGSRGR